MFLFFPYITVNISFYLIVNYSHSFGTWNLEVLLNLYFFSKLYFHVIVTNFVHYSYLKTILNVSQ